MGTSHAVLSFLEATKLEENAYDEYEFSSKKEADSFRVALYTEKRNLRDNSVLISISGNKVRLTKKDSVYIKKSFSKDGEEIKTEVVADGISNYEKRVSDILALADEFEDENKKSMFIADAMRSLHSNKRRNHVNT